MKTHFLRAGTAATAIVLSAAMALAGVGPAAGADPVPGAPTIDIVDTDATAETNSLYQYLLNQQGAGVLFGHQHTTDNGVTFTSPDGVKSDVLAATGEYPAIFGWDTLILEGKEGPGTSTNTPEQNAQVFANGMINADRLGGINTISAHMKNFVTGNGYSDTSGRVVSQILPGAPKHAEFNAYLDLIAATANATVRTDGTPIPIIFRPFHENTGSWFWWGAAHATPGEFKEIYRYTVEYLRDVKGVSNFLYAFSPNGAFAGDEERYLATYPGDDWVDILGYDAYESDNSQDNSAAYIESVRVDLAMVTDVAAAHGKIPAFTEFGRNGPRTIKQTGNKSLTFYTDLFNAIKSDPKASRITYMETWANWDLEQFYVPYPAFGSNPEHEMYRDFLAFYNDPYSVFSAGVTGAYNIKANAEPTSNTVRFVSPADGARIVTPTSTLRVKTTGVAASRVYVTAGNDPTELGLTLVDGYWTAEWDIGEENLNNSSRALTAVAVYEGGNTLEARSTVILGKEAVLPLGVVDDFNGYTEDAALRAAFSYNNAAGGDLSLVSQGAGDSAVQFAYDFTSRTYGGFGKILATSQDWSGFNQVDAWLDPDGGNQKLVLQVNTANGGSFEAYPSLAGTEPVQLAIDFLDFRAKGDPTRTMSATDLRGVKEFWVYINQVGASSASSILLDDIQAVSGSAEPTLPVPEVPGGNTPGLVDDFEKYADDAALRAAWSRPGAATLSLSADQKASGKFGAAFPFTPAFDEFQKAVNADWSAFDQLSMWVKPDGNEQQVVFQLVAGGFYYDSAVIVSGVEAVEKDLLFSEFTPAPFQGRDPAMRPSAAELADVQQLVMFIQPTGNSTNESGVIYLDDIRASLAKVDPPLPVPAESTTSLSINKSILFSWQKAKVAVSVGSAGAEPVTGDVTLRVGGKSFVAAVDTSGKAKFSLPKLARGVYLVRATYGGDENTAISTSGTQFILVLL